MIYEAARRLPQLLAELIAAFGPNRHLVIVREATKIHEEVLRGTIVELAEHFADREALGEVTLVIERAHISEEPFAVSPMQQSQVVEVLREAGLSLKDASAAASKITGASRRKLYQKALERERCKTPPP